MSDTDRDANRIAQFLQVVLEQITICSVAASTVAQQQDAGRIGIALLANAIPIPTQAISGKLASVVTEPDVDMTDVTPDVVDAVGDQLSIGPTREIVIKCLKGRGAVDPALYHALTVLRSTGVPCRVTLSADWLGVWLVKTALGSSGSPVVCNSSESIRLLSSWLSESIFFFDRHRGDERDRQQGQPGTARSRGSLDRWCFGKRQAVWRCR